MTIAMNPETDEPYTVQEMEALKNQGNPVQYFNASAKGWDKDCVPCGSAVEHLRQGLIRAAANGFMKANEILGLDWPLSGNDLTRAWDVINDSIFVSWNFHEVEEALTDFEEDKSKFNAYDAVYICGHRDNGKSSHCALCFSRWGIQWKSGLKFKDLGDVHQPMVMEACGHLAETTTTLPPWSQAAEKRGDYCSACLRDGVQTQIGPLWPTKEHVDARTFFMTPSQYLNRERKRSRQRGLNTLASALR